MLNLTKKSPAASLLDMMLALIVFLSCLGLIGTWVEKGHTAQQQKLASEHLMRVNEAASEYVKLHYVELYDTSTKTTGPQISIQNLIDEELLPYGFQERNVWKQDYEIHVRQMKENELQAIVLTTSNNNYDAKFLVTLLLRLLLLLGSTTSCLFLLSKISYFLEPEVTIF